MDDDSLWYRIAPDAPSLQGRTSSPFDANCPSRIALDHLTSKWGVLVLVALSRGPMRWGELHRFVEGVSEKMLAQTLRVFESDGYVTRTSHGTVPPHVDYELTPLGREAMEQLLPLVRWVASNVERILPAERLPSAGAASTP